MKWFSVVGVGLAVGLSQVAHASFELALVCDYTGHKIDRYDPITRSYLGSFGQGIVSGPVGIAVDRSLNLCYVTDQTLGRTLAFNYNTGEFINSYSTGGNYFVTHLNNGDVLVSNYSTVNTTRYNSSFVAQQTINTNGIYLEGHAQTADGTLWFLNGATSQLFTGSLTSSTITASYSVTPVASLGCYLTSNGQQLAFEEYNTGTSHRLYSLTTSGTGVLTSQSVGFGTSGSEMGGGVAIGHGSRVYGVTTTGTASTLYSWLPGTSVVSSFALSQTSAAQGMALVVAPEPGVWMGLALGSVALLRRRRR